MKKIDMQGKTFGRLTVGSPAGVNKWGQRIWNVVCSCGGTKVILGGPLRNGHTKSCGCLNKENMSAVGKTNRSRPYESLYNNFCSRVKERGTHSVFLTYEEFVSFTTITSCTYCGEAVTWVEVSITSTPTGRRWNLDRKDNNIDYYKDNCVVCCKDCNYTKSDRFTYEQMLQIGALIKTWHT